MPFKVISNELKMRYVDAILDFANPNGAFGEELNNNNYDVLDMNEEALVYCQMGEKNYDDRVISFYPQIKAKYFICSNKQTDKFYKSKWTDIISSYYERSLFLALENGCKSVVIPLVPLEDKTVTRSILLNTIIGIVESFLETHDMMIYLLTVDKTEGYLSKSFLTNLDIFNDNSNVKVDNRKSKSLFTHIFKTKGKKFEDSTIVIGALPDLEKSKTVLSEECKFGSKNYEDVANTLNLEAISRENNADLGQANHIFDIKAISTRTLKDFLTQQNETFQQMLLRLIKEKGYTNVQAYTKANQDKKLFSKIKNNVNYQPKKKTVLAFALALKLNLDETNDLLASAGFAFSPSNNFDRAIQYFIEKKLYNIYEIEIVLYDLGLGTLCNYN